MKVLSSRETSRDKKLLCCLPFEGVLCGGGRQSSEGPVELSLVDPPAAVRPGFLARARMVVEKRKGVLLVPEPALQRGSETPHFVWVLDGETARVRPVEPGERVDGRVVIRTGLAAGDEVVVEGLVRLRDGGPARRAAGEAGS